MCCLINFFIRWRLRQVSQRKSSYADSDDSSGREIEGAGFIVRRVPEVYDRLADFATGELPEQIALRVPHVYCYLPRCERIEVDAYDPGVPVLDDMRDQDRRTLGGSERRLCERIVLREAQVRDVGHTVEFPCETFAIYNGGLYESAVEEHVVEGRNLTVYEATVVPDRRNLEVVHKRRLLENHPVAVGSGAIHPVGDALGPKARAPKASNRSIPGDGAGRYRSISHLF